MVKSANNLDNEKKVFKPNYMLVEEAHVKNWEAEIEKGKDIEKYWQKRPNNLNGSRNGTRSWMKVINHSTSGSPMVKSTWPTMPWTAGYTPINGTRCYTLRQREG